MEIYWSMSTHHIFFTKPKNSENVNSVWAFFSRFKDEIKHLHNGKYYMDVYVCHKYYTSIMLEYKGMTVQIWQILSIRILLTLWPFLSSAIGCPDPQTPSHGWVKRTGNKVEIGCGEPEKVWQLTCYNNRWLGEAGNCSDGRWRDFSDFHSMMSHCNGAPVLLDENFKLFFGENRATVIPPQQKRQSWNKQWNECHYTRGRCCFPSWLRVEFNEKLPLGSIVTW